MADIFQTVEYSRDKWTMNKVPLALLLCLAGLVFVIYADPRPPDSRSVFLFAFHIIDGLIGPSYSRDPGMPGNVFGRALILGAVGWIGFALYRHFRPARPILMLSPAGLSFHVSWLKDLLIPWHEIRGVDGLEITGAHGPPNRFPETTVVLVSKEFYEQHILPKRSFLSGRFWKHTFLPKGASMQMVLPHWWFSIDSKDIREPLEARWKAFRSEPPSDAGAIPRAPTVEGRQVYGAWSIDGSVWQTTALLVPLIGIVIILVDSTGIWPR